MPLRGKGKGVPGDPGGLHSPPSSASKRTTSGAGSQVWSEEQSKKFLAAFHKFNQDWDKVAKAVGGGRTAKSCEALHKQHLSYLNLPKHLHNDVVWAATVADHDPGRKDEDDERTTSAGGVVNGSILSGGTSTPSAKGRRTPRTVNKAAPRTPVSSSKRTAAPRSNSKGQTWGMRGIRNSTPADGSTGKRKRIPAQLWEEEDFRTRTRGRRKRGTSRDENADEMGADALLSLAALVGEMDGEDDLVAGEQLEEEEDEEEEEEEEEQEQELAQQALHLSQLATPNGTPVKGARSTPRRAASGRRTSAAVQQASPPSRSRPRRAARNYHREPSWRGSDDDGEGYGEYEDDEGMGSQDRSYGAGYSEEQEGRRPRSKRKPVPEKVPPMLSPIKSLFSGRRLGHGISLAGLTASLLNQSPGKKGQDGDRSIRPAELKLRHALEARPRRWATSEFLYSAIDRPWFMQNEFKAFLEHMGLGGVRQLARPEWAALRAALGKPRRLSLAFLQQQRAELEAHRSRVRAHYAEAGVGGETPAEVARALTVGQRVSARHPATRHIHDGDILTVAPDCYRVMFDRRELGVELVKDVDVMPIDPVECLPTALLAARPNLLLNGRRAVAGVPVRRQPPAPQAWEEGTPSRGPAPGRAPRDARSLASPAWDSDTKVLAEVARDLDKKEALLVQLRCMNSEAEAAAGGRSPSHSDHFQRSYAQVVLRLKDVNQHLARHLSLLHRHVPASPQQPGGRLGVDAGSSRAGATEADAKAAGEATWQGVWPLAQRLVAERRAEFQPRSQPALTSNGPTVSAAMTAADGSTGVVAAMAASDAAAADGLGALVAGCVSLLMVVQSCAQSRVPSAAVGPALDAALASLQPKANSNKGIFRDIKESVATLKRQLA